MYITYIGNVDHKGRKDVRIHKAAEVSEVSARLKRKQFPGLCIADDHRKVHSLLYDRKVAAEVHAEVCTYMCSTWGCECKPDRFRVLLKVW